MNCKFDELGCEFDELAKMRMSSMSWINYIVSSMSWLSCTVSSMSWLTRRLTRFCTVCLRTVLFKI